MQNKSNIIFHPVYPHNCDFHENINLWGITLPFPPLSTNLRLVHLLPSLSLQEILSEKSELSTV